ncbi:MAG: phage tail tape measure protein, partial [Desulfobacteraceae bacterium]|nr:phage tail tape measure protein [Desulfobacteraceae bacterium]
MFASTGTIKISLQIDEKGTVRVLKSVGTESERTGKKGKKAFDKMDKSAKSFTRSAGSVSSAMLKIGAGVVPILALQKALSKFSTLDKGLIGVQKTTNMTNKEIKQLKEELEKISMKVPVTTAKLLEIAEAAGQLGVKGVKDVTLFTETMAKLEIASDVVGGEGAKSLARLLNTAGESTDKIDELGSVIVALGNNMAASEKEIVFMAGEIGRSVSSYNVASEASLAWGAALKAMGARAELSGSAIGRSMIEIDKAITNGGKKFEYLKRVTGMTGDQIKKTFEKDASEVFNAWIIGMNKMTKTGESAASLLAKFGFTSVETIKGLTPLIKNVGQLEKSFNIANREIRNATALDKEAMAASKSFSAQMDLTWNAVDKIASKIGAGLAPEIVKVTEDFREWAEESDGFIKQELPGYIDKTTGAVKGLYGGLKNIKSWYDSFPSELVAGGAMGLIGVKLFGIKPGLLIGTIVTLNQSLKSLSENLDLPDNSIQGMAKKNNDAAKSFIDLYQAIKQTITGVKAYDFETGKMLSSRSNINDYKQIIGYRKPGGIESGSHSNINLLEQIKNSAKKATEEVNKTNDSLKTLTDFQKTAQDSLITINIDNSLKDFFSEIDAAPVDNALKEYFAEIDESSTLSASVVQANLDSMGASFDKLYSNINDKPFWAKLQEGANNAMENIKTSVMSTSEIVEFGLTNAVDGVANAFGQWASGTKSFKDAFSDMAKNVLGELASMIAKQAIYNALASGSNGGGGSSGGGFWSSFLSNVVGSMSHTG